VYCAGCLNRGMGMAGDDIKEKMDKRLSGLLAEIALSIVYL